MGDCVLVMEEGVPRMDSVASGTGSLVQIESIEIDLRSSMEPPKPERFSIRGFVADMRRKNREACLPFGDADDRLPPMSVPSFRWWQCPTCVPDTDAQRGAKGKMVVVEMASDRAGTDSLQNVEDEDCIILHSTENRDVGDKAGNSCDASEANQLQIVERLDNSTTDVSDMVRPSCMVDNPELGNDGVPPKRKPKLRSIADIMGTERNPAAEMEAVFELDVPAEAAKDAASSERKRKTGLGEDGGPSRASCRKSAAKRIKGLNIDGGKNCGRVEISDSGSEEDASMRSDLKVAAKSVHKRTKAVNNSKKMKQKIHKEDKTAPMRKTVHVSGASSSNAQKHGVSVVIKFGKSGRSPSTTEETGPLVNLSKSKMPEVGDCSIGGKAALDLSLNDNARLTEIPDLNEEPIEGNLFATLPEQSLPLHNTWDASPHCRNGTTSEGKRPFTISESENNEACREREASDDIPMEIVELLAKNQRERAVGSSRNMLGINNSLRGYSALCVDGRPSPSIIGYPHNRPCGLTLRNGNLGLTPQLNSYHRMDTSRTEDSSTFWSFTRDPNSPFHLNIAPKHSIQPSSTCRDSDSVFNRSVKGKTVTDMKDTGGISTSQGSLDPYSSNETIPAMQLLSLMNQRVAVHSSFEAGAKHFLDKSFSPSSSSHHPKKQSFHNGKLFSQDRHSAGSKNASCSYRAQLVQEAGSSKASHLATSDSEFGVCTLNRNPADFSIPDARNEFTISGKDLKFRKRNNSKDKSRMPNVEAKKGRQRMRS